MTDKKPNYRLGSPDPFSFLAELTEEERTIATDELELELSSNLGQEKDPDAFKRVTIKFKCQDFFEMFAEKQDGTVVRMDNIPINYLKFEVGSDDILAELQVRYVV